MQSHTYDYVCGPAALGSPGSPGLHLGDVGTEREQTVHNGMTPTGMPHHMSCVGTHFLSMLSLAGGGILLLDRHASRTSGNLHGRQNYSSPQQLRHGW